MLRDAPLAENFNTNKQYMSVFKHFAVSADMTARSRCRQKVVEVQTLPANHQVTVLLRGMRHPAATVITPHSCHTSFAAADAVLH